MVVESVVRATTTVTQDNYTPAMMLYDGDSGKYDKSITHFGNKITVVGRFKIPSYSGSGLKYIMGIVGATNRLICGVFGDARTNSDENDKFNFLVYNTSGAIVCHLISTQVVADNELHSFFLAFDGDAGAATYKIDDADADNTGATARVAPTTGSLITGVVPTSIGASSVPDQYFDGQIGSFGYHDVYLTNSGDFFDGGTPKKLDESGWTEWGTQPVIWNEHGECANNKGDSGDFTLTATVDVGKGGN